MTGPGGHLKHMLANFMVKPTPDCPCEQHARQMDEWGAVECRKHVDEIVGWLETEARRWRLLKFLFLTDITTNKFRREARWLVLKAIRQARHEERHAALHSSH